jgi:hypothetical protein
LPESDAQNKETKMKNRSRRTILIVVALAVALGAILASWNARRVDALAEDHNQFVVGLTSGQTARLNVLNSGEEIGLIINWKFFDSQGRVLAQSPERQLIPPGQMMAFDLNADELNAPRDRFGRIQIRAVAQSVGNQNDNDLRVSLEVFDNATGKTTVLISSIADGQ